MTTGRDDSGLLHSSVRTCTAINVVNGARTVTVTTARLTMAWREGELALKFEMHRARAPLQTGLQRPRTGPGSRER